MKTLIKCIYIFVILISVSACGGGSGDKSSAQDNPARDNIDGNAVTNGSVVSLNGVVAIKQAGELPAASNADEAPNLQLDNVTLTSGPDQAYILTISIATAPGEDVASILIKVDGADTYFELLPAESSEQSIARAVPSDFDTSFTIEMAIEDDLVDVPFCIDIRAVDSVSLVSEVYASCPLEASKGEGARFTRNFLEDRVFASTGENSDQSQLLFFENGSGSIRFTPNEDNDFSQNDISPIIWEISNRRLIFTEIDDFGGSYDWILTPTLIDENGADFTYEVASSDGDSEAGAGSMDAKNPGATLAGFSVGYFEGRVFELFSSEGGTATATFLSNSQGSVTYPPGEYNNFNPDDTNPIIWSVDSGNLRFTEADSDGEEDETVISPRNVSQNLSFGAYTVVSTSGYSGNGQVVLIGQ